MRKRQQEKNRYLEQKEMFLDKLERLKKIDPLSNDYIKLRTEAIDEFKKYKKLFIDVEYKNTLKEQRNVKTTVYIVTTLGGTSIGLFLSMSVVSISSLMTPNIISITSGVVTIVLTNILVTSSLNKLFKPFLLRQSAGAKERIFYYFNKDVKDFEKILTHGFNKRNYYSKDTILDVETHVENIDIDKKKDINIDEVIFDLPENEKVYSKKKKF